MLIRLVLVAMFFIGFAHGANAVIKPAEIKIGSQKYTILYQSESGKRCSGILKNTSGVAGHCLFLTGPKETRGTIYLNAGTNYLVYLSSTKTNITVLPKEKIAPTDQLEIPASIKAQHKIARPRLAVTATADNRAPIDVLVLYTAAAMKAAGGSAADVTNSVELALAEAQEAYANSDVYIDLHLAGLIPVSYTEAGDISKDLSNMASEATGLEGVSFLRDTYNADLVCMVIAEPNPIYSGMAYLLHDDSDLGYSCVDANFLIGNYTFVHELGHGLGCDHDRDNGSNGYYSYSYGYRFYGINNAQFRTVMAYAPGTRIPYFSSPDQSYLGFAVGTATENNALTLNQRAWTISEFRSASGYAVTFVKNGTGTITWNGSELADGDLIALDSGETITITASGSFLGWSGDVNCSTTNLILSATDDMTVVANFADGSDAMVPIFSVNPLSQNVPNGGTLQLTCTAVGIPTPTVSWSKNGVNLGKTGSTLTVANASGTVQGTYQATASNSAGTAKSTEAVVVVGKAPQFVQQPVSQIGEVGGIVDFSAILDTDNLTYQWFFNSNSISGATNRIFELSSVDQTNMGKYFIEATGSGKTVRSLVVELDLVTPPAISKQPMRIRTSVGQTTNLSVTAVGIDPLIYQWYKDGVAVTGATNAILTLKSIQTNSAGIYMVQINNPIGITMSSMVTVAVGDPLVIKSQPVSIVTNVGSTPILGVTAGGAPPLSYQWYFNGVALQDQVYSSCRLKNIQINQAGSYFVIVSNLSGAVTSSTATISIQAPPVITTGIGAVSADAGSPATLAVLVSGNAPLSYTWTKSGTNLNNNASSLVINSVAASDAGTYVVTVTNADGSANNSGTLTVYTPPQFTSQSQNLSLNVGVSATLFVAATGASPILYQWYHDGVAVGTGATNLLISSIATSDAGNYYVIASNRLGTTISSTNTIVVHDAPKVSITNSVVVDEGDTMSIPAMVTGATPMTYSWTKNGTAIVGQTNSTLTITNFGTNDVGYYAITAKNADGTATSGNLQATIFGEIHITGQPVDCTVTNNGFVKFKVTATGGTPIAYQWFFNSNIIDSATNSILNIGSATTDNEGTYFVVVTNRISSETSDVVALTLTFPPVITNMSGNIEMTAGQSNRIWVAVEGRQPMSYKWTKDGSAFNGSTNYIVFASASSNDSGSYVVTVSNKDGSVTSGAMVVHVTSLPIITTQPADVLTNKSCNVTFTVGLADASGCTYAWSYGTNALGTNASLVLYNVQLSDAGTYTVTVKNAVGSVTSRNAILTILDPPVFTTQPADVSVKSGATLTLTALAASSVTPITYQWLNTSGAIVGQTNSQLILTNADSTFAGKYAGVASNSQGVTTSSWATVTYQKQPPTFTTNLLSAYSIDPGGSLTLTVATAGKQPIGYNWTKDGSSLSNTTDTYIISNARSNSSGVYQVTASNDEGSTASIAATVKVVAQLPIIATQPSPAVVPRGGSNTFQVVCSNPNGLVYQWYHDGAVITNATNSTLTVTNVGSSDVGNYDVIISNDFGSTSSATVALQILDKPVIITDLADVAASKGSNVKLGITTTGTNVNYTWLFNGAGQSWSTNAITITNLGSDNEGTYQVGAYNAAGTNWSRVASVTMRLPPTVTTQPTNMVVAAGDSFDLTVVATGRGPLSYQWIWNTNNLLDATNTTLTITNSQPGNSGYYWVNIIGADGMTNSSVVRVIVDTAPVIITQPQDAYIQSVNGSTTLTVVATSGTGTNYQWRFGGTNISGATNSGYAIKNASAAQEGGYDVVVSNAIGGTTSRLASVTVFLPPIITSITSNSSLAIGSNLTMTVTVTGHAPLTYQWYKMANAISGATNNAFAIASAQSSDIANYFVTVANADGCVTSSVVQVTLSTNSHAAPYILTQPADVTVKKGGKTNLTVTVVASDNPAFIWIQNGTNLLTLYTNTYSLTNADSFDSGTYSVIVSNAYGTAVSTNFEVNVLCPPVIVNLSTNSLTVTNGSSLMIQCQANDADAVYWKKDGVQIVGGSFVPVLGGISASLDWTAITTSDSGSYTLFATNNYGTTESSAIKIAVVIPPTITTQPVSVSTTEGETVTLSVVANGTGTLNYQWFKNAVLIAGATTNTLVYTNSTVDNSGNYSVVVSSAYGTNTSSTAIVVVNLSPTALPKILVQPKSVAVNSTNLNAILSVTVGPSATPLTYIWTKDGNYVSGATNSTLSILNATSADEGTYQVVVANSAGRTASQTVTVTVAQPPVITSQSTGKNIVLGVSVTLSVTVTGRTPFSYQWRKNGTAISGAVGSTYQIASAGTNDFASYDVTISNTDGTAVSTLIAIGETPTAPAITAITEDLAIPVGTVTNLVVTATGSVPLSYQWYYQSNVLIGATQSVYALTMASTNGGEYEICVSNGYGTAWANVEVTLIVLPTIVSVSGDTNAIQGGVATFSVIASNATDYTWYFGSNVVASGTNNILTIKNVQFSQAGDYSVIVKNTNGKVTQKVGTLTVYIPPQVVKNPISASVSVGETITLTSSFSGTGTLTYQWYKNATIMLGATNATLVISNATVSASGEYSVLATSPYGSVLSDSATVVVNKLPSTLATITTQPGNLALSSKNPSGTLTVVATSTTPVSYQWNQNGTAITNATNSILTLTNAVSAEGTYYVAVSNEAGTIVSASAVVTVAQPPVITTQLVNTKAVIGSSASFNLAVSGRLPFTYFWFKDGTNISTTNVSTLTIATVTTNDFGNYYVAVTNTDGCVTSSIATLTEFIDTNKPPVVVYPPVITSQPTNLFVQAGQALTIVTTGSNITRFIWFKDDAKLTETTNGTLSIASATTNDSGTYVLVASNSIGSVSSSNIDVTVFIMPYITLDPISTNATAGDAVTLTAAAAGSGSITYQWSMQGTVISGATNGTLILQNLTASDNGSYAITATSSYGSIRSHSANVVVNSRPETAPTILTQPSGFTLYLTNSVGTLCVTSGVSYSSISYQWKLNGTNIPGATNNVWVVTNTAANEGTYQVVLKNAGGTTLSQAASVIILQPPVILEEPESQFASLGKNCPFTVYVTGRSPLSFLWYKNGKLVSSGASSIFTLVDVTTNDWGSYYVIITNSDGAVTSSVVTLAEIVAPPRITVQSADLELTSGLITNLFVTASGTAPLTYQWFKDGDSLLEETNRTLIFTNTSATNAGTYFVAVTNAYGFCVGANILVTFVDKPMILSLTTNIAVLSGGSATLVVDATNATSYTWYQGATKIGVTLTNSLTLSPVISSGTYSVIVSNKVGTVTSSPMVVTIGVPPAITSQPAGTNVIKGDTVTLDVAASGSGTLVYQWYKNGLGIIGATTNAYILTNAQTNQSGYYAVSVNSEFGAIRSGTTYVAVNNPPDTVPVITNQPVGFTLSATNTSGALSVVALSTTPLSYQWMLGGTNIPDATNSVYTVTNDVTREGSYQVSLVNKIGRTLSQVATVIVLQPPVIVTQPTNASALLKDRASFWVVASGRSPLAYQWNHGGTAIVGGTGATLKIASVSDSDFGTYSVIVTNTDGSVTSSIAMLSLAPTPPVIVVDPTNTSVAKGDTLRLTTEASGTAIISYSWFKDGALIQSNNTNGVLSITNVASTNAGTYFAVATNNYGSATSAVASVTVLNPPTIAWASGNMIVTNGGDVQFSVTGTDVTAYYWKFQGVIINKTTVGTLGINAVTTNNAGSYTCLASNNLGVVETPAITLSVKFPPVITLAAVGKSIKQGKSDSIFVEATGSDTLYYQWFKDGSVLDGETATNLVFTNMQSTNEGYYFVCVTNSYGSVTSTPVAVTMANPPVITVQPQSQVVTQNNNLVLNVTATGRVPMTYSWLCNGTNIGAASSSTLSISNVQGNQAGTYTVQIANADGSIISTGAVVSVILQPYILATTQTISVKKGGSFGLAPTVGGSTPLFVIWYQNGVLQSEKTNILKRAKVTTTNEGTYTIICSNTVGCATSIVAVVTIQSPPTITKNLVNQSVAAGDDVVMVIQASGRAPFYYRWYKNTTLISGATSSTLVLTNVSSADEATYTVAVSNGDGTSLSKGAKVSIVDLPVITTQPVGTGVKIGGTATLSVNYSSEVSATVQWYQDDVPIDGATNKTLTIKNTTVDDAGTYYAEVENAAGITTSSNAEVYILYPPTIIRDLKSTTVVQGATLQLEISVEGTQPMGFAWLKDGVTINGPNTRILAIQNIQPIQAGKYSVIITNTDGSAVSGSATVTVLPLPVITEQPSTVVVTISNDFQLNVTATSTSKMSYQWMVNGTNISGGTNSILTVTNSQWGDAGDYTVQIANANGTITSDSATVIILPTQPDKIPADATNGVVLAVQTGADKQKVIIFYGCVGYQYKVQGTPDGTNWTTLASVLATKLVNTYIDKKGAQHTNWTYRVSLNSGSGDAVVVNTNSRNQVISVNLSGKGTIKPNYVGLILTNGIKYTLTASETAKGFKFIGWNGSVSTNGKSISFTMADGMSLTAVFQDVQNPTLTVKYPKPKGYVSNQVVTVTGTASDNGAITGVYWSSNQTDWNLADGTTNWTADIPMVAGTNVFTIKAVDTDNNEVNSTLQVTYVPSITVTIQIVGSGTVTPNLDKSVVSTNKSYKMTATAGTNYVFKSWQIGNFFYTTPVITFIPRTNTDFIVTFVPNPYMSNSGSYQGIYGMESVSNGGFATLTISKQGVFSCKVAGAVAATWAGKFDLDGNATATNVTPSPVKLSMDMATGKLVTGTIKVRQETVNLVCRANTTTLQTAKTFGVTMDGPSGQAFNGVLKLSPQGDISTAGNFGTKALTSGSFMTFDHYWPCYIESNGNRIIGWGLFDFDEGTLSGTGILQNASGRPDAISISGTAQ